MNVKTVIVTGAAVAALGLAGCSNTDNGRAGGGGSASRFCTPFPEANNNNNNANVAAGAVAPGAPAAGDPAAAVDDCLHRWGYTLAASSDPADQVADAVVAACASNLSRWNQQGLTAQAPGAPAGADVTAPSLVTGQPSTPLAEHYNYAQGRALFYVVQARAGKCAPPPAPSNANTNGANNR